MPVRLDRNSADFDARFAAFLAAKREVSADVERATRAIVDDVAARGDAALSRRRANSTGWRSQPLACA
jgi:histidinol dehydrogenase